MVEITQHIDERAYAAPPPAPAWLVRVDGFFRDRTPAQVAAFAAALTIAFAALDVVTGPQIAFSAFYLIPIGIAAWYLGWEHGLFAALAATLAWLLADVLAQAAYDHPAIQYWNALVRGTIFTLLAYVLSMLHARLRAEAIAARTDALTGLPNWRAFQEIASRELARAQRMQAPLTVAYLDMDDFKRVNDTRGHDTGNEVLATVGGTLRRGLRITDVVARVGGDEFVLLLPDCGLKGAQVALAHAAEQLRAHLHQWSVGFSIGAVSYTAAPGLDLESLIRPADDLMYRAKAAGKNTIAHVEA